MRHALRWWSVSLLVPAAIAYPGAAGAGTAAAQVDNPVTVVACVVREADYVRDTAAAVTGSTGSQLLLVAPDTAMPSFGVTGTKEQELAAHLGRRVEVSGTIEQPRNTPILATVDGSRQGVVNSEKPGAAGVTPEGGAAHEASDAVGATVRAGSVTAVAANGSDLSYRVATLPRVNATAVRRIEGSCPPPPARQVAVTQAGTAAPVARGPVPAAEPRAVTARGCLVRQTATGTALTPQRDSNDSLTLTDVAFADDASAARTAVPGASPSGSGSGTLPAPTGTSGLAPVDEGRLSLALAVGDRAGAFHELVGQRVEATGTIPADALSQARGASAPADTAHPSAPAAVLTVTSLRAVGGGCN